MWKGDAENQGLKIEPLPGLMEVRGYSGGKLVPLGIASVKLQVDHAISQVIFHIVLDGAQNIPLIVGQSFFEPPNIVMVKPGKTVRMYEDASEGNDIFGRDILTLPPRVISLSASKSEIILLNHIDVIEIQSDKKIIWFIC